MTLTPRENLLRLWRRQGYENAPVQFSLCPSLVETYKSRTGDATGRYGEHFGFPCRGVEGPRLPEREPVDWSRYYRQQPLQQGAYVSIWGVGHEKGSEAAKHMTRMRHPLEHFESLEEYQAYPYPDFEHASADHMAEQVRAIHARGLAAEAQMACTIWETAWYMRGMENLMADMMDDAETAVYHFDRITDLACVRAEAYARAGADHIHFGDDIGMQKTIMMSESLYREWIKPRLQRVIDATRRAKPDIVISYHSCGYVVPFIPDLIEVGVDVLNPIQPECMDFAELHAEYGDRLSFWGTLGTQTTMPFGTPEEVRRAVHRNLEIAGSRGGLLCAPTHLLEPEVPWEKVMAYVDACREFSMAGG